MSDIHTALDAAEQYATAGVWAGHPLAIILEALIKQTRAALAEPVGEGPSDEELIDWHSNAYCPDVDEVNDEEDSMFQYTSAYLRELNEHGTQEQQSAHEAKGLRAVFEAGQRYGAQSTPPAPESGEVGELVAWLRELGARRSGTFSVTTFCANLTRAATLLQQQEARIADLRLALRECGRAVGSLIQDSCSDSFLLQVPDEIRLAVAKAAPPAPVPVPVAVGDALIKAECALSDVAEGEETNAAPNTFEWAEQRCAETLAIIRPVMKRHAIRTSEWPPQVAPAPVPVAVSERPWERHVGWCDSDGDCWWCPPSGPRRWILCNPAMVSGGWLLPAHFDPDASAPDWEGLP
jgi:hypothetical protein